MFRSLMTRTIAVAVAFAGVVSSASAAYEIRVTTPDAVVTTLADNGVTGGIKDNNLLIDRIDMTNGAGAPVVYVFGGGTLTFTTSTTFNYTTTSGGGATSVGSDEMIATVSRCGCSGSIAMPETKPPGSTTRERRPSSSIRSTACAKGKVT